jgi:hypothetical protein
MGFFDWLFGRAKSKSSASSQRATFPAAEEQPEPVDFEQTMFVSLRLSPKAQAETKKLREFKERGSTKYRWAITPYACFDCKKFAAGGPYDIAAGLMRAAPLPGRETGCDCETSVEAFDR